MNAAWILLGVGAVLLLAAIVNLSRNGGRMTIQARTWLIIAGIFGVVGAWLIARS